MRAGLLLAFLTGLNVLNFMDRSLFSVFANQIIEDLQLSHLQFALLDGLLFTLVYGLSGLYFGLLADRLSRFRVISVSVGLWSGAVAMAAMAPGFVVAALSRLLLGVGQAGLTPPALSWLADHFAAHRRGLVASIYYLGPPIGVATGLLLAAWLGSSLGWRGVFALLAAVGLLLALFTWFVRDERVLNVPTEQQPKILPQVKALLLVGRQSPALIAVLVGTALTMMPHGALVLEQVWLVHERGFAEAEAQGMAGIIMLTAGVLGGLLGGWASDKAERQRPGTGRFLFLMWACIVIVPINLCYRLLPVDGWLFLVLMFISVMTLMFSLGPLTAAVQELVPAHLRGTAVAMIILFMTLLGYSPGAALTGWLSDLLKAQGVEQAVGWALAAGVLPVLLAAIAFWFAQRLSVEVLEPPEPLESPVETG